jgi:hypothetical protein
MSAPADELVHEASDEHHGNGEDEQAAHLADQRQAEHLLNPVLEHISRVVVAQVGQPRGRVG